MHRLYRLFSPGIVFAVVGIIVLAAGKWSWFHLRGGLVTVGVYALGLQIVLSAVLVSAIDDLSGRGLWHRTGELVGISARPISFSRALAQFYRRPFWPMFLLAFGLGASLAALLTGAFGETGSAANYDFVLENFGTRRSEVVLGGVLLSGAALLLWRGGRSYFGWVIGMTLATVLGEILFVSETDPYKTVVGWGGLMIGLALIGLAVLIARSRRWTAMRDAASIQRL